MKVTLSCLILLFWGCSLPWEPGPMPTEIIEVDDGQKLNVFGVLRYDGSDSGSFVHVQKLISTEEMYSMDADVVIRDARVLLMEGSVSDSHLFVMSQDPLYDGYYYPDSLQLMSGQRYRMEISTEGYPTVYAETVIPEIPTADEIRVNHSDRSIHFRLEMDSSAARYAVRLHFSGGYEERVLSDMSADHYELTWAAESGDTVLAMEVAAYDKNLFTYLSASTSIIPQTYHQDMSTVEGGLGCIGSIALQRIDFLP